jgi:hypothetical protein
MTAEQAAAEQAKLAENYPVSKRQKDYSKEKELYENLEVGGHVEIPVPEGVEGDDYKKGLKNSLERRFPGLVDVVLSFDGRVVKVTRLAPKAKFEDEFEVEFEDESNQNDEGAN